MDTNLSTMDQSDQIAAFRAFVKHSKAGMQMIEYWRLFLDPDGKQRISIGEFCSRLRTLGYENVRSLRTAIVRQRVDKIHETSAVVAAFDKPAKTRQSPTSSPVKFGPGTAVSEWRPGSSRAPLAIRNAEHESLTLRDLDLKTVDFVSRFVFRVVRKILAVAFEDDLDIDYLGKKAGRKVREKMHELEGIVFEEKPVLAVPPPDAKDAKKSRKDSKKGSKAKEDASAKPDPNASAAPAGAEEEEKKKKNSAPSAEEKAAKRRFEAEQLQIVGDRNTYRSIPRRRAKELLLEYFFGDGNTAKITSEGFQEKCVEIISLEAELALQARQTPPGTSGPNAGTTPSESGGGQPVAASSTIKTLSKSQQQKYKREMIQMRREARHVFPLLIRKHLYKTLLLQEDVEFAFDLMEMEYKDKHFAHEVFILQDVPVAMRSPRVVGLKTTGVTRETLRATQWAKRLDRLDEIKSGSPRILSPTGDPRRRKMEKDEFGKLVKDVQIWKNKLKKKYGTLTKAWAALWARAIVRWDEEREKREEGKNAKSTLRGLQSRLGEEAEDTKSKNMKSKKEKNKDGAYTQVIQSDSIEDLPVIFDNPPNLLPLQIEITCFEFNYMCEEVFKKFVEKKRLNLAAVYFYLIWEECPPPFVYNATSRQGPELLEWVMKLGVVKPQDIAAAVLDQGMSGGEGEGGEGSDPLLGSKKTPPGSPAPSGSNGTVTARTPPQKVVVVKPPVYETRKSIMTLRHFDMEGHALHIDFQRCLVHRYGHVGKAMIALDEQFEAFRIDFKEFHQLLMEIQYLGNPKTLWGYLDSSHTGFLRFDVIDFKLARSVFGEEYLDYKQSNEDAWLRLRSKARIIKKEVEKISKQTRLDYYSQFKQYVKKRGLGNVSRVWRKYLDTKGKGYVSYEQFAMGCTAVGYSGNSRTLFWHIGRGQGSIAIDDMEPALVEDFTAFVRACKRVPGKGSVLAVLQGFGFRNIEEPVKKSTFKKLLKTLKFMVLVERKKDPASEELEGQTEAGGATVDGAETEDDNASTVTKKSGNSTATSKSKGKETSCSSARRKSKAENAASFDMVERDSRFYHYLFDHLDIFDEKRIFPDDLLALEKLLKGTHSLSDIYAERTQALRERQKKVKEALILRRSMYDDQIEHQRLVSGLKTSRSNGKQQVEKLFIKMERSCGSVLRAWFLFFDSDNAGICGYDKFAEVVKQKFGMLCTTEMWAFLDYNKKGFLSLENFDPDVKRHLDLFVERLKIRYGVQLKNAFMQLILNHGGVNLDFDQFRELCREVKYDGNPRRLFTYLDREISGYVHLSSIDQVAVFRALETLSKTGEAEHLMNANWAEAMESVGAGGGRGGGPPGVDAAGLVQAGGNLADGPLPGVPAPFGAQQHRGQHLQQHALNPDTDSPRLAGASNFGGTNSPMNLTKGFGSTGGLLQVGSGRAMGSSAHPHQKQMDLVKQFREKLMAKYHSLAYGWRMLFGANNEVGQLEFHHAIKNLVNVEYVGNMDGKEAEIHGAIDPDPLFEKRMRQRQEETEAAQQEAVKRYLKELWDGLFLCGFVKRRPQLVPEQIDPQTGQQPPPVRTKPELKLELFDPDLAAMISDFKRSVESRYGTFANLFANMCFSNCRVPMDCEDDRYWTKEEFRILCDEIAYPRNPRLLFYYFSIDCKHLYCRNLDYAEYDKAKEKEQKRLEKEIENNYNAKATGGGAFGVRSGNGGMSTRGGGGGIGLTMQGSRFSTSAPSRFGANKSSMNLSLNDSSYDFNLNTHRTNSTMGSGFNASMLASAPNFHTLASFLEILARKSDNNLLLGWVRFLDTRQRGKLDFKEFCEQVTALGFKGNLQNLWREIFLRLDFFSFVPEQEAPHKSYKDMRYVTYDKLDPYNFLLIEAFRKPLAAKYKTAQVAFEDLQYGPDDFFLLCQELKVKVTCRTPAPPAFLPKHDADDNLLHPSDMRHKEHFFDWCQNLVLKRPRRMTRSQSEYLFSFLNLRKKEKISTDEVTFLDTWWKKPGKKKRAEALNDMRKLRDPRRIIEEAKARKAAEELAKHSQLAAGFGSSPPPSKAAKKRRKSEKSERSEDDEFNNPANYALGENYSCWSPLLHSRPFNAGNQSDSNIDQVRIAHSRTHQTGAAFEAKQLLHKSNPAEPDFRSNWNPRHHVVDNEQNRYTQYIYEMIHIERFSDRMKAKVQKKADAIPITSWIQSQMGGNLSKDKLERLQPRPPPIKGSGGGGGGPGGAMGGTMGGMDGL